MSHSVQVSVALNAASELKGLDYICGEINSCAGVYQEHLKKEISELQNAANEMRKFLHDIEKITVRDESLHEYQRTMSTLAKRVANIRSSINYGDAYKRMSEKNDASINELIVEYGFMAITAIEELESGGKSINSKDVLALIEKNRHDEVESNELNQIQRQVQIQLIDMELPDEVKSEFVSMFTGQLTRQEIMDLFALMENKVAEFNSMIETSKTVISGLEQLGFEHVGNDYAITEKGEIELQLNLYKDKTKDFSLRLNTSRGMDWQFGDYEQHMCDADGVKFREEILPEIGLKTTHMNVTRNKSNSRPLRKARALKIREI